MLLLFRTASWWRKAGHQRQHDRSWARRRSICNTRNCRRPSTSRAEGCQPRPLWSMVHRCSAITLSPVNFILTMNYHTFWQKLGERIPRGLSGSPHWDLGRFNELPLGQGVSHHGWSGMWDPCLLMGNPTLKLPTCSIPGPMTRKLCSALDELRNLQRTCERKASPGVSWFWNLDALDMLDAILLPNLARIWELRSHAGDVQSMYTLQSSNIGEGTYGSATGPKTYRCLSWRLRAPEDPCRFLHIVNYIYDMYTYIYMLVYTIYVYILSSIRVHMWIYIYTRLYLSIHVYSLCLYVPI
jgi:hypothetical protein